MKSNRQPCQLQERYGLLLLKTVQALSQQKGFLMNDYIYAEPYRLPCCPQNQEPSSPTPHCRCALFCESAFEFALYIPCVCVKASRL